MRIVCSRPVSWDGYVKVRVLIRQTDIDLSPEVECYGPFRKQKCFGSEYILV